MAQMREAVSAPQERKGAKPGPMSMKGVSHLSVRPGFKGKVKVMHHYDDSGPEYKPPVAKEMEPEHALKHVAGFLGVKYSGGGEEEEPGGGEEETPEE